jgi:hypothetical protein
MTWSLRGKKRFNATVGGALGNLRRRPCRPAPPAVPA